jgi:limonene-1,2-epoxide hydrolase
MSEFHEQAVLQFLKAYSDPTAAARIAELMAEDGKFYEQMGQQGIQGRANIKAWLDVLLPKLKNFSFEVRSIGSAGSTVFFERRERFGWEMPDGSAKDASVQIVAVVEVREDGKISEWRDYFTISTHLAPSSIPAHLPRVA